ncbi:rod shape-determining protein RodA, partial [bacterium]|nr:rod shape-determining protein RodA [bacterium]
MIDRRLLENFDFILFFTTIILCLLGIIFIESATSTLEINYAKKQLLYFLLGFVGLVIAATFNYSKITRHTIVIYGLSVLLLIVVLLVGKGAGGAKRWISLGIVNFQPSELFKITSILMVAYYLDKTGKRISSSKALIYVFLIMVLPILLIIIQPDLGTALSLIFVIFTIVFVSEGSVRNMLIVIGISLVSCPFLWKFLKTYQKKRLTVFINPDVDPLGAGYAIIQSKIAVGVGGLFGYGWKRGYQTHLNFIPEHHTDFIFSTVAEEWGFIGACVLLLLYAVLFWRMFSIAALIRDKLGLLIIVGIISLFAVHIFINIGMAIGIMPITGLTLPFLSYGGTSLIVNMFLVGLVL